MSEDCEICPCCYRRVPTSTIEKHTQLCAELRFSSKPRTSIGCTSAHDALLTRNKAPTNQDISTGVVHIDSPPRPQLASSTSAASAASQLPSPLTLATQHPPPSPDVIIVSTPHKPSKPTSAPAAPSSATPLPPQITASTPSRAASTSVNSIICPRGCGQWIPLTDLDSHELLHDLEAPSTNPNCDIPTIHITQNQRLNTPASLPFLTCPYGCKDLIPPDDYDSHTLMHKLQNQETHGTSSHPPPNSVTSSHPPPVPSTSSHLGLADLHPQSSQHSMICPFGCGQEILVSEFESHKLVHILDEMEAKEGGVCEDDEDVSVVTARRLQEEADWEALTRRYGFSTTRPGSCFTCGAPGHWSQDCPKNPQVAAVRFAGRLPVDAVQLRDKQRTDQQYAPAAATHLIVGLARRLSEEAHWGGAGYQALLCGPVQHFSGQYGDRGWGCGWRNIQMLCSHLILREGPYKEVLFGGRSEVPDIGSLQAWLEAAWTQGFDVTGAESLGNKIQGDAKWIGATEAATLLRFFNIQAHIADFTSNPSSTSHHTNSSRTPTTNSSVVSTPPTGHGLPTTSSCSDTHTPHTASNTLAHSISKNPNTTTSTSYGQRTMHDAAIHSTAFLNTSTTTTKSNLLRNPDITLSPPGESHTGDASVSAHDLGHQQDSSSGIRIHPNVACDLCGQCPIQGVRYKSQSRGNYDLCEECVTTSQGGAAGPFEKLEGSCGTAGGTGGTGASVQELLAEWVWRYFSGQHSATSSLHRPCPQHSSPSVTITGMPPLYFQHEGHSRTIIGIERLSTPNTKHTTHPGSRNERHVGFGARPTTGGRGRGGGGERGGDSGGEGGDVKQSAKYRLLILDPGTPAKDLERALRCGVKWQQLLRRNLYTLRKAEYELVFVTGSLMQSEVERNASKVMRAAEFYACSK